MSTPNTLSPGTDTPALATLREMAVGDTATFPAHRASYIRSVCTRFGFEWSKTFSTSIHRDTRTITVTRTA